MFNTDLATIETMKSGNLGIKAPFNGAFKKELKGLVPSAKWQSPYWIIKPSGEKQARELLAKFFPPASELQKVRIEWVLDRESPEIDGVDLATVTRDWWGWRKDCPIDFEIIEQSLKCGGSAKYPGLYGKLIIQATVRPDAYVSPAAHMVILEDGQAPNPLVDFSTEQLLAKLEARGIK